MVTTSPGLSVRSPESSSGVNASASVRPGINGEFLALAGDRNGLNAGQVRPELLEIERGAIERMIERLFGYRELLALRPHFGRRAAESR